MRVEVSCTSSPLGVTVQVTRYGKCEHPGAFQAPALTVCPARLQDPRTTWRDCSLAGASSSSATPACVTSLSGSTSAATARAVNVYVMAGFQQEARPSQAAGRPAATVSHVESACATPVPYRAVHHGQQRRAEVELGRRPSGATWTFPPLITSALTERLPPPTHERPPGPCWGRGRALDDDQRRQLPTAQQQVRTLID